MRQIVTISVVAGQRIQVLEDALAGKDRDAIANATAVVQSKAWPADVLFNVEMWDGYSMIQDYSRIIAYLLPAIVVECEDSVMSCWSVAIPKDGYLIPETHAVDTDGPVELRLFEQLLRQAIISTEWPSAPRVLFVAREVVGASYSDADILNAVSRH